MMTPERFAQLRERFGKGSMADVIHELEVLNRHIFNGVWGHNAQLTIEDTNGKLVTIHNFRKLGDK